MLSLPQRCCWLLPFLAAALFFSRLDCPLLEPEEARYAEIPRQMLASGHLIVPVLHGEPYLHKPPLFYWLVMACYTLFGVHDWSARIVPATAGCMTVLVCYFWGRRTLGSNAGLLAAFVLLLFPRYIYMGRMLILDGLLCLFITAALACAHCAVADGQCRLRWWLSSAFACGLALLTKGPVGLLLVWPPLGLFVLLNRREVRPAWWCWLAYLGSAGAVAAPWYLAIAWHHPGGLIDFLFLHNLQRYVDPLDHVKPIWYYLPDLLLGTLPWSLLLPILLALGARREFRERLRQRYRDVVSRSCAALAASPATFYWLAGLWCVVFFSLSGCKRPAYILPAFPPLALGVATLLPRILTHAPACSRWLFNGTAVMALGVMLAAMLSQLCSEWAALFAVIVLLAVIIIQRCLCTPTQQLTGTLIAGFAFTLAAIHFLLPDYHRRFGLRDELAALRDLGPETPVVCCPRRWDSAGFYLKRNDVRTTSVAELHQLLAARKTIAVLVKANTAAVLQPYRVTICAKSSRVWTAIAHGVKDAN